MNHYLFEADDAVILANGILSNSAPIAFSSVWFTEAGKRITKNYKTSEINLLGKVVRNNYYITQNSSSPELHGNNTQVKITNLVFQFGTVKVQISLTMFWIDITAPNDSAIIPVLAWFKTFTNLEYKE